MSPHQLFSKAPHGEARIALDRQCRALHVRNFQKFGNAPRGRNGETVREQKNYFASQAERMHYEEIASRGWPIGSGAVESACSGHQNRFKRRGQFWTHKGLGNLAALKQARENKHWDELWFSE